MIRKMKCFLLGLLTVLLSANLSADSQYSAKELERLKKYIQETDYAARLKPISVVILDNISEKQENDYYQYVTTYQVVEIYKGDLPEYILVPEDGEFSKEHDTKRYYTKSGKLVVITGFCKRDNNYYFPETHSTYMDVEQIQKVVEQAGKKVSSIKDNRCKKKS